MFKVYFTSAHASNDVSLPLGFKGVPPKVLDTLVGLKRGEGGGPPNWALPSLDSRYRKEGNNAKTRLENGVETRPTVWRDKDKR